MSFRSLRYLGSRAHYVHTHATCATPSVPCVAWHSLRGDGGARPPIPCVFRRERRARLSRWRPKGLCRRRGAEGAGEDVQHNGCYKWEGGGAGWRGSWAGRRRGHDGRFGEGRWRGRGRGQPWLGQSARSSSSPRYKAPPPPPPPLSRLSLSPPPPPPPILPVRNPLPAANPRSVPFWLSPRLRPHALPPAPSQLRHGRHHW